MDAGSVDSGGRVTRALRKRIASIDSDSSSRPGTPIQSKLTASTNSPLKPRITRRNSTSGVGTPVKTPGKRVGTVAAIAEIEGAVATPPRRVTRRRSLSSNDGDGGTPQQYGSKAPNVATLVEKEEDAVRVTRSKSKSPQQATTEKLPLSQTVAKVCTRRSLRNLKDDEIEKENSDENDLEILKEDDQNLSFKGISPQKIIVQSNKKDTNEEKLEKQDDKMKDCEHTIQPNPTKETKDIQKTDDNASQNKSAFFEKGLIHSDDSSDTTSTLPEPEPVIDHSDLKLQVTPSPLQSGETVNDLKAESAEKICKTPSPSRRKSSSDADAVTPIQNRKNSIGNSAKAVAFNSQISDDECEKSIYPKTPGTSKSKSYIDMDTSFQGVCDDSVVSVNDESVMEIAETQQIDDEVEIITESVTDNDIAGNESQEEKIEKSSAAAKISPCSPKTPQTKYNKRESVGNFKVNDNEKKVEASPKPIKESNNKEKRTTLSPSKESVSFNIDLTTITPGNDELKRQESPSKTTNVSLKESLIVNLEPLSPLKESDSMKTSQKSSPSAKEVLEKVESHSINESLKQTASPTAENTKPLSPRKESDSPEEVTASPKVGKQKESSLDESSALENGKSLSPPKKDEQGVSSRPLKWCNPSITAKSSIKLDTIANEKENNDKQDNNECANPTMKQKKKKRFVGRDEWNSSEDESDHDQEQEERSELDLEDEPYRRKNPFYDDEAVAVDDYESGDSMDSEERREILENEVPVDCESIGSQTTDEDNDHGDEEESDDDSFIVSDKNEEDVEIEDHLEIDDSCTDSDDEDEEIECNKREKRKSYKRIQHVQDSSSEEENENIPDENENNESDADDKPEENNALNSTKLSDSALRLQIHGEDSEQSNEEESDGIVVNQSRKEILRKLNQSDRFNKSVRDLNPDVDVSPEVELPIEEAVPILSGVSKQDDSNSVCMNSKVTKENSNKSLVETNVSSSNNKSHVSNSGDIEADSEVEMDTGAYADESEPELGESTQQRVGIPITSEEKREEEADQVDNDDTDDNDKENESSSTLLPNAGPCLGLSVSFGHLKGAKKESLQKRVLQRSFTIGVCINGGELGTAVIENKPPETATEASAHSSSTSPASSNEENNDPALSSEDIRYLENIKHMPLGNPLVRTRRQSLALPTNPDMEICSSPAPAKKPKRKSLAIPSGNEFNPSQSFVDSLELRKAEFNRQTSKRKRLSKSFCGTSEGLDNSIIDLDARHLHKRSKLAIDSSFVDSLENLSTNIKSTGVSKVKHHSSTPREKEINNKNKSDNSMRRILNRCDEILEAANRAKLEAKINYKKSKVKRSKMSKKKMQRQSLSPDSKHAKQFAPVTKEFKRKDKIKKAAAVKRALKASADIIIGKQRKTVEHEIIEEASECEAVPTVLEPIAESQPSVKAKKNKKNPLTEHAKFRNYATSAGNVIETLRTPEKKKKPKIIHLPTGKVCVEPITPIKHSILTCNGMEFRESPATPFDGLGFSIQFSALDTPKFAGAAHARDRKRKRNIAEEATKIKTFPKPQWTQSGLFLEEEIPRAQDSQQLSRILKKHQTVGGQQSNFNFKHSALMRGDIKRCSTREILQLRERRQFLHQNNY